MADTTRTAFDIAVIGAGPAGLAAAAIAAASHLDVALLDEQPAAGGQIFRALGGAGGRRGEILGADYVEGKSLLAALDNPRITHLAGASVWNVTCDREVQFSH
jgi:NADPH-dependent 2,4-dienoyl-CoA reductase/sulfur reductase-like enzyme